MATAHFGTGIFGTDTFSQPTGASFSYLPVSQGFTSATFSTLVTSGAIIPQSITTLFFEATIAGHIGRWDIGTFDGDTFLDTESSFASLVTSGTIHEETFSVLETSIGEIRIPGTTEEFRTTLAATGNLIGNTYRTTTLLMTGSLLDREFIPPDYADDILRGKVGYWLAWWRRKMQ